MEYINGITKNEYNNTKETKDQEDSYDKDNCSEDESSEEEDNESSDESSEEEDNESSEESSEEEDNESSEESSEEGDNESSEEEDNENSRYKTKFVEENGGKKIAIIKVGDKEESEYVGIMSEKGREIIEKYGSREDRYILEISKNNSNMRKILKEGATYEELLKMCYECYIKDIDILYIYIGRWV